MEPDGAEWSKWRFRRQTRKASPFKDGRDKCASQSHCKIEANVKACTGDVEENDFSTFSHFHLFLHTDIDVDPTLTIDLCFLFYRLVLSGTWLL